MIRARLLPLGTRTIRCMVAAGQFPEADIAIGNKRLWRTATILAWIDEQAHRQGDGAMKTASRSPFEHAAEELAFLGRRIAIEYDLLGLIYAINGDCRAGVAIARAQGIRLEHFTSWEHRLLWCIAEDARDTAWAGDVATLAHQRGRIFIISVPMLLDSWPWFPAQLQRKARQLVGSHAARRRAIRMPEIAGKNANFPRRA